MFGIGDPVIKFKCHPDLHGKIPEPYPARHYIPDWYKKLEMFFFREEEGGAKRRTGTIKRCPPVLDALVTGWIIPLVADVEFTIRDGGSGVSWICGDGIAGDWIVQHHILQQLGTHPNSPKVPLKFMNHWIIETPPGWSCLFTPPMNRPENNIELISGLSTPTNITSTSIFQDTLNRMMDIFVLSRDILLCRLFRSSADLRRMPIFPL